MNFLKKLKNNLVFIVLIFSFLFLSIFSTNGLDWKNLKYSGNAITSDEISHIASGYYYLKTGKYFINPEHPFLVKDVSAFPLLFLKLQLPNRVSDDSLVENDYPYKDMNINQDYDIANSQWQYSKMFIYGNNNPDLTILVARIGITLFNTLLLALLGIYISKIFSKRIGLIFLFIVTFSPFLLANGSIVIMDFTSSIFQVLSLLTFAVFLKKENYKIAKALPTVLFTTLALLAKFSSVLLIPVLFLFGLIYFVFKKKSFVYYLKLFLIFSFLILILLGIGYSLHVYNVDKEDAISQFNIFLGNFNGTIVGDTFRFLVSINIPIIKNFFVGLAYYLFGVLMVVNRIAGAAQSTYFLGGVYGNEGAGWRYFPVLLLTKLHPLIIASVVILSIIAATKIVKGKLPKSIIKFLFTEKTTYMSIAFYAFFYMLYTFSSSLQIGLRHIMPVIFITILLLSVGISKFWKLKIINTYKLKIEFKHLMYLGGIVIISSTIINFPYYLSYYNIFGGGTDNGYKIATDSNYDWGGQDLKRLGKWVKDNNVNYIYTDIFTNASQKYYLGNGVQQFDLVKDELPNNSYIAVSIFQYMNNVYSKSTPENKKYDKLKPYLVEKIGTTILIYHTN